MKQTGDESQLCILMDNLLSELTMKQQNNMSNSQWYEKFTTRINVAESVGVEFNIFRLMNCKYQFQDMRAPLKIGSTSI